MALPRIGGRKMPPSVWTKSRDRLPAYQHRPTAPAPAAAVGWREGGVSRVISGAFHRNRLLFKLERIAFAEGAHHHARLHPLGDDRFRQGVFQEALDHALERPRAVHRIEPLLDEQLFG